MRKYVLKARFSLDTPLLWVSIFLIALLLPAYECVDTSDLSGSQLGSMHFISKTEFVESTPSSSRHSHCSIHVLTPAKGYLNSSDLTNHGNSFSRNYLKAPVDSLAANFITLADRQVQVLLSNYQRHARASFFLLQDFSSTILII